MRYTRYGLACLLTPPWGSLQIISQCLIASSYIIVFALLVFFARKRSDQPFSRIFLCFGIFAVACGAYYAMEAGTIQNAGYWLTGILKLVTALISVATTFALARMIPMALSLPSQADLKRANEDLESLNDKLRGEIEERIRAEELLDRSQQSRLDQIRILRSILDSMGDGVVVADQTGQFIVFNPAAEQMLGGGAKWAERYHTCLPDRVTPYPAADVPLARAMRGEEVDAAEVFVQNPHRPEGVCVSVTARPLKDEDGRIRGGVVVLRDITQQKHGERILKEAKEEAERANQAKSEFLSRMSHELRTPLNAILGFAQLLEMEDLRQENRESVEQILKGGRHLLELINEVLDITRIETGNISLSPEPVYVLDAVQQAMDLVRPLAAHRDIRLRVEPGDRRKRHVLADRQRLIQVLLNLLSNAVKYNRAKGSVTVGCQEIAGGKARLTVCDTGFGISEQDIEKLFSPFERLKADQAGVEGTGLGLALSRRLAEVMGGVLGVESRLGQGSTFWIELALVEDPLHRLEREDALTLAKTISGAERRAIVYIEDNLSNLRLMEQIFAERPEIKLIASMQGELGLDLAREHHPDLILLDLHLPDIPGEQVLRRLREDPGTRDIPVIVVSADATPRQIDRLLTAGAKEYLTKPLDIKKFLKVLDEHLKGSQTPVHSVN